MSTYQVFLVCIVVALLGFQVSCVGVDEKASEPEYCFECEQTPFLNECTCEQWMTYVDDLVDYFVTYAMLQGSKIDRKAVYNYIYPQATMHKSVYISGLKDALNAVYTQRDKKRYLPYKEKEYFDAIHSFCEEKENKDKKISEVLLIVNEQFKKARP
jgi:hypothetical protein